MGADKAYIGTIGTPPGVGLPAITNDTTGEAINDLTRAMYKLLEEQKETNRLLRKEIEPPSKWVSQEEAAVMLGQTIKKSGAHKTHLKRYRENGWLTIFPSSNPYRYSRKEVEALAKDFLRSNDDPNQKYPMGS